MLWTCKWFAWWQGSMQCTGHLPSPQIHHTDHLWNVITMRKSWALLPIMLCLLDLLLVSLLILSCLLVKIILRLQLDNHLMTATWTREVSSLQNRKGINKQLNRWVTWPYMSSLCLSLTILVRYPQVSILVIWNSYVEPVSLTLAKLACAFWHTLGRRHKDRCHIHTSCTHCDKMR